MKTPKILLLSFSIAAALTGCQKPADKAATDTDTGTAKADAAAYTLDESKLPAVNRFQASDLDPSKDACTDFAGYANAKFLAANPIPGDRTSWGAFEMLDERSNAVQRQLAEQAAARKNATGVDKIVGDFWATGMDEAKIEAQGIQPIQAELASIDALTDTATIAEYLRSSAAKGRNMLFGFGAEADFKDSTTNLAYASQGGLGLPDPTYYTKPENKAKLDAYQAHAAKMLELSGTPAADAAKQAGDKA